VTGAVQAKISQTGMKKIPVIIANKGVLDDFSEKVTPIYNKIRANSEEITHLTALRDTLLPKLMSGEIDVNEVEI
jgi:type I restriction enzyme S subunit